MKTVIAGNSCAPLYGFNVTLYERSSMTSYDNVDNH